MLIALKSSPHVASCVLAKMALVLARVPHTICCACIPPCSLSPFLSFILPRQLPLCGGFLNSIWNVPGNPRAPAWWRAVQSESGDLRKCRVAICKLAVVLMWWMSAITSTGLRASLLSLRWVVSDAGRPPFPGDDSPGWQWEHFWLVVNLVSIVNNIAFIIPLLGPDLLRTALEGSKPHAVPAGRTRLWTTTPRPRNPKHPNSKPAAADMERAPFV